MHGSCALWRSITEPLSGQPLATHACYLISPNQMLRPVIWEEGTARQLDIESFTSASKLPCSIICWSTPLLKVFFVVHIVQRTTSGADSRVQGPSPRSNIQTGAGGKIRIIAGVPSPWARQSIAGDCICLLPRTGAQQNAIT